ncbi:LysR family transcriptional regulator [Novosphingobium sp. TH158]|uniref:LysR family transcriptional regulator n=1 Tax=Novosphingobium sp. TH158 TaxID=2067455 RepID=UPI00130404AB|nr:LysR family transcriptional regulator [Novosphingobium sp. TH158]
MDWDDLKIILAIAREGTLTGAARVLGLTQPTMGRRLAAFEDRHGARLLQRMPGGYVLTPLGESVLAHAERIEAEVLAAERAIMGRDVALAGTVRVTTVDLLAPQVVVPVIARLQAEHPGICIELVPDSRLLSLSKREADIALRPSRFRGAEIHARRVGRIGLGIYAARDALDRGEPLPLVTTLEDQGHLAETTWLRALYPDAPIAMRSNDRHVHLQAALAGIGLTVLSRFQGDAQPGLRRLHSAGPEHDRELWLGVHADLRHVPRIRVVIEAIAAEIAAQKVFGAA